MNRNLELNVSPPNPSVEKALLDSSLISQTNRFHAYNNQENFKRIEVSDNSIKLVYKAI